MTCLTSPTFIAFRVLRRGARRDGAKINSPRRKPLFLHLLMVTQDEPGYSPDRIWLNDVELRLEDGWAINEEFCDEGANLVYCQAFPDRVPPEILASCWDFRGLPPRRPYGVGSYIYLRLEWRKKVFDGGPFVQVSRHSDAA